MKAEISRASKGLSEGRSIKISEPGYNKKQTLKAINDNYNKNYSCPKSRTDRTQDFNLIIKLGSNVHKIRGHCNKNRGDFYISQDEWNKFIAIEFNVGGKLDIEIIGVEDIAPQWINYKHPNRNPLF